MKWQMPTSNEIWAMSLEEVEAFRAVLRTASAVAHDVHNKRLDEQSDARQAARDAKRGAE